jgi:hypothetical protein
MGMVNFSYCYFCELWRREYAQNFGKETSWNAAVYKADKLMVNVKMSIWETICEDGKRI